MTTELGILSLYGILVLLMGGVERAVGAVRGWRGAARPRPAAATITGAPSRFSVLQVQNLRALTLFAPAVLILAARDIFSGSTILAAQAFLGLRLLHLGFGIAGRPRLARLFDGAAMPFVLWLYLAPFLFHGTQSA